MAVKKQHLSQIVDDLKTDLDTYQKDAITVASIRGDNSLPESPQFNEWLLQIADIYEAAYGEELDLKNLTID